MYRATTPKQVFTFEENPVVFSKILITYVQNGKIILEKTEKDLTFDEPVLCPCSGEYEYPVWFRMTQEEANLFNAKKKKAIFIQVRVLTEIGEALASEPTRIGIQDVLNDEVLS